MTTNRPHTTPPMRPLLAALALPLALLGAQPAAAQNVAPAEPAAPAPAAIAYPSVAAALAGLRERDGNGTVVTESDGWTVINEPPAAAQWSFVPKQHPAHPAVIRRVITRDTRGRATVHTASLCEAPQAACERLLADFMALNDRITQATRGRTPPVVLPR